LKITKVETLRLDEFPNIMWVRIYTDEGLVGLGETFMGAQAVEAYIHEWAGPKLLGKDPLAIEARNRELTGYLGWRGSGAETRGKGRAWAGRATQAVRMPGTWSSPDQEPTWKAGAAISAGFGATG
jgi:hypothetical protein